MRFRSPENVAKEVQEAQRKGLRSIHFVDDTFGGGNRQYIDKLCSALTTYCRGIKWSCELHPSMLEKETVSRMKNAGCCSMEIGVESGNNGILRKIGKNTTIEEVLSSAEIVKQHGIEVFASLYSWFSLGN